MITRKPHWINDFQHEHLYYKSNFDKKLEFINNIEFDAFNAYQSSEVSKSLCF